MKKRYSKNRYPEIKISPVETMDQTSLEFLYPLPSYLVVDNPPGSISTDEIIESDSHSELSSREISMNEEKPLIENVEIRKVDKSDKSKLKMNKNTSESNGSLAYNDLCDRRDQISIKEEVISQNGNGFSSTPRYDDKHSCKVLIKTVYCD